MGGCEGRERWQGQSLEACKRRLSKTEVGYIEESPSYQQEGRYAVAKTMSGKMNWRRAAKNTSPTLSLRDEWEFRDRDAASKWIKARESTPGPVQKGTTAHAKPEATKAKAVIEVFTDGACEPNPGVGGWACVVYDGGREKISWQGGNISTTNNRMEMIAVKQAILWLQENGLCSGAVVFTDSSYVANGCNVWRHAWKRKGWKKKNSDLWIELDAILSASKVAVRWIRRDSHRGNQRADELSKEARWLAANGHVHRMTYDLSAEESNRLAHFRSL